MQSKNKSLKQKFIAIVTVIALVAMALSVFAFTRVSSAEASGLYEDVFMRDSNSVSVTNGDFGDTNGSGKVPEPSSWNAEEQSSDANNSTVHGVIDLDTKAFLDEELLKEYKLDGAEEFENIAENFGGRITPFGTKKFSDTNTNALFLNSGVAKTFYGYNSAAISLNANSYYEISAWVKSSDFGGGNEGATVKITGMKNPLSFKFINTVAFNGDGKNGEANDYGWVQYSFYIETSAMHGSTVNIGLELGNYTEYVADSGEIVAEPYGATGYVFFDNVTASELSATQFEKEVAERNIVNEKAFESPVKSSDDRTYFINDDGNTMLYSENDSEFLSIGENGTLLGKDDEDFDKYEIGSFDNGVNGWSQIAGSQGGSMKVGIFNGPSEDDLGITDMRPFSPNGENDNIAVISNYRPSEEKFSSSINGWTTAEFTVPKMTNYRLSVWVNACNGAVASAALYGEDYRGVATTGPNAGLMQKRIVSDLTGGDDNNKSHNGWKEIAFYLKGSYFTEYKVRLEIWLGKKTLDDSDRLGYSAENVSGVAMFDNIRIEEITVGEFNSYSNDSTKYVYDYVAGTNDIVNYSFNEIDDGFEKDTLPAPSDWTLLTAGEDDTAGMSKNIVNENYRDIVHTGVISSNDTEYTFIRPSDNDRNKITESINTRYAQNEFSRLLMLRSDDMTGNKDGIAVGYRSSSFSVASDKVQKVDVTLLAENINGYGANIVVKNGTNILATIEGIKDTKGYETYSVYLDTIGKSFNELHVEIWLGLYDKEQNKSKLSQGTLFIDKVELSDAADINVTNEQNVNTEETKKNVEAKVGEYENRLTIGDPTLKFAIYSVSDSSLVMFDRNDVGFLKTPYNWDLSYSYSDAENATDFGIFNGTTAALFEESSAYFPDGYKQGKKVVDGAGTLEDANAYSIMVFNKSPATSRVTSRYSYQLDSGSFYTITVYAKVDIPASQKSEREDYKGAYIGIAGTDYFCSDIKSTVSVTDFFAPETDDNSNFQKFTIHVHTAGDESSDSTSSINLEFGIGGQARGERAVGALIINSISVEKDGDMGASFETAKEAVANGSALNKKYNVIADYTAGDEAEDDDDSEDNDTTSPSSGDNWYVYITIILAVVVLIAIVAFAVRYFAKKRKRDNSDPNIKASYDRAKTLAKQVKARDEQSDMDEYLDTYDRFDEDEEDRLAEMKEEAEFETIDSEEADGNADVEEAEGSANGESDVAEEVHSDESEDEAEESGNVEDNAVESGAESEAAETNEAEVKTEDEAEEEYRYDEEIVDFTPSVEQKRILAEKKAEAERIKAEKEAEEKRKEAEKAKLDAEKRAATRRNNNWDDFED